MSDVAKKSNWAFGRIDDSNVDQAIRYLSQGWYAFAVIQAIALGLLYFAHKASLGDFLDPAVAALAGYFLQDRKSRALAVVLFLYAVAILSVTIANRFGYGQGGTNIFLGIALVWAGWRGIPATWFYQKRRCAQMRWLRVILNSLATAMVAFIGIMVAALGIGFASGAGGTVSQAAQDLSYSVAMFFPAALTMAGLTMRWPFTEPDAACPWPPKKSG